MTFRTAESFPWEFAFHLTMLNRQPWCSCGRGFFPEPPMIVAMSTDDPEHACECGQRFPIREGYLRAFTKDYTRQAQLAFLSNWVQAGYVDASSQAELVDVHFTNPLPDQVADVLTQPQIQYPVDTHAGIETLHVQMSNVAVASAALSETGFRLMTAHELPIGWTLRTTWRAYGRRRLLELPPWRQLLRQALLVEKSQVLDPAIGMLHSAFEAFADALIMERLATREGLGPLDAAKALEEIQDGLPKEAKRELGVVLATIHVLAERCGFVDPRDVPVAVEWAERVRRPRNRIFHGQPIGATPEDARLAFGATLRLMDVLDRRLIPGLVLECFDGLGRTSS